MVIPLAVYISHPIMGKYSLKMWWILWISVVGVNKTNSCIKIEESTNIQGVELNFIIPGVEEKEIYIEGTRFVELCLENSDST